MDLKHEAVADDPAGVADLAAALCVERRLVEDDNQRRGSRRDCCRVNQLILSEQADHLRGFGRGGVADELGSVVIRLLEDIERTA